MVKEVYRDRVRILTELWADVNREWETMDREALLEELRRRYEEEKVRPLRGFKAENIYEKELITFYVVGRDGLGLFEESKEVFEKLLYQELRYEEIASKVLRNSMDEIRPIDGDTLSRALRLIMVRVLLSFSKEEELFQALRNLDGSGDPEFTHTAKSFSRFYTAFKLAESMSEGAFRDRLSVEAAKKAIAISIGISYPSPRNSYIALIASEVFRVSHKVLSRVLELEEADNKSF
ncbi:hypothetical protein HS1genome_2289 [Sulfodiicoccus acidiphilus]|uniref:DUF2192 domain-containing protein n=1 Tax=Sulfodiicoccus acidiphilus TaxID=1670455 RepID=A0A348B6U8_9CREN|nr:hypothetical protein HS1genome_2289 [Sulfodiicoccus acidiphilus]GGT96000.1 hypothetical protein GCM10007116_11880 [Sulfodiicoccus acidiphilus]